MTMYELNQDIVFKCYENELPENLWEGAGLIITCDYERANKMANDDIVLYCKDEHEAKCLSWLVEKLFDVIKP